MVLSRRIHEGRTACKRIRAVLALAGRPRAGGREIFSLARACAQDLSALREATVNLSTWRKVLRADGRSGVPHEGDAVRRLVSTLRLESTADHRAVERTLSAAAVRLRAAQRHIPRAFRKPPRLKAAVEGFAEAYRKARDEAGLDYGGDVPMHRWRKRTKVLTYHCALLTLLRPEILKAWRHEYSELDGILGDEHDLQRLDELLSDHRKGASAGEIRSFRTLIRNQRSVLRAKAIRLGRVVFSERPSVVRRSLSIWADLAAQAGVGNGANGEAA
jgi:hypothetical protein